MKYLDLIDTIHLLQNFLDELSENCITSTFQCIPAVVRKSYFQERIKDILERTEIK